MARKADPFSVWGQPPQVITKGLTKSQLAALRRYTEAVADRCYRVAFDNGVSHAFEIVSTAAQKEWKRQRGKL